MKKTLTYSSLLVLALAITSCGKGNKAYDASGVFESTEVTVSAEGNGKIMSLDLQEGDRLEAGAVVGCIDTVQLYLSKIQLKASRRAVGSGRLNISRQIAALESQIAKQRQELDRFTKLEQAGDDEKKKASALALIQKWETTQKAIEEEIEARKKK